MYHLPAIGLHLTLVAWFLAAFGTVTTIAADEASATPAIVQLTSWLKDHELNDENLTAITAKDFSAMALTADDATQATSKLWQARTTFLRDSIKAEFDNREIVIGELKMPFWYKVFGEAPAAGRSLFISMHGGGGAPAEINDQQYENQKGLYRPEEGVYLVPRAATNSWDLWHQSHIDAFFDRLITDMILFEHVNPDRVYIMGYSAGGDGVYQLAPRMADRLAAAAMMAGHPNESRPEGLRNIAFTIQMGANDIAYNRNAKAQEWSKLLDDLQASDQDGYIHKVAIHPNRGHWMNLDDAVAVPWMAQHTRSVWPKRIVWTQDDVLHDRFYWLRVPAESAKASDRVVSSIDGNVIHIEHSDASNLTILLNDHLLDLNMPVTIKRPSGDTTQYNAKRTIGAIAESLNHRFDEPACFTALIDISMGESKEDECDLAATLTPTSVPFVARDVRTASGMPVRSAGHW